MRLNGKLPKLFKECLDYLSSVLNVIKDLGLISLGLLTLLYFLFPSFENFIRIRVQGESKYFYVGAWDPAKIPTEKNHTKFTEVNYDLDEYDCDPESGVIKEGIVILATGNPIVGRSGYGRESTLRKFIGKQGDCLLVLESVARPIPNSRKTAIWVKALPNVCK